MSINKLINEVVILHDRIDDLNKKLNNTISIINRNTEKYDKKISELNNIIEKLERTEKAVK